MSSAFDLHIFKNSKSSFINCLPLHANKHDCIELRSLIFDNRISCIERYEEPVIIINTATRREPFVDERLASYTIKEALSFNFDISFSLKLINKTISEEKEIHLPARQYGKLEDFLKAVNKQLFKTRSMVKIGVTNKNEIRRKLYFKIDPYYKKEVTSVQVILPDELSYALGFSRTKQETFVNVKSRARKQARYGAKIPSSFFTSIKIVKQDIENSSQLFSVLEYIFLQFEIFDEMRVIMNSNSNTSSSNGEDEVRKNIINIYILDRFVKSFMSEKKIYGDLEKVNFISDSNSEYYSYKNKILLDFCEFKKPKLIKVFLKQLSHSPALTSTSLYLLALLPFRNQANYKYETENPLVVPLYNSKIDKLSILLTDEHDRQLKLASGVPSFLHCRLTSNNLEMYKICHFNSDDEESKKYFPSNSQSQFTQNLLQPIDARKGEYYASLQSVYIPPALHNINAEYTNFTVEYTNQNEKLKDNLKISTGHYTKQSFLSSLNILLKKYQITLELSHDERISIISKNANNTTLTLNSQLSYMLGCSTNVENAEVKLNVGGNSTKEFIHTYKFLSLVPRFIKVKTNFVEDSLLGNCHQPIFRIVNIDVEDLKNESDGMFFSFNSKHWIKLIKNVYNTVVISFFDENDVPLSYSSTKAVEGLFIVRNFEET